MSPSAPTITAVIPAYNSAEFLGEAIDSILRQSVLVSEIIVVDDGSVDDTASVARRYDVTLIQQSNAGPSAARNRGIEHAQGELIAFLDADDQWTCSKLTDQLTTLNRYPELALVASDMAETNRDGAITTESMLKKHALHEKFRDLDGAPLPKAMTALLEKNFIPTGTVLARRAVLRDVGAFNPSFHFAEDLELWTKVAAKHPITCLAKVHMLRRQHESNATRSDLPMLEGLLEVMGAIRDWGDTALRAEGQDPNALVAASAANLGYWHFTHGDMAQAEKYFSQSLREKMTTRGLAYWLASQLPATLVERIRGAKQQLTSRDKR
ncbi:MAG: glycosyltransferase family 2 protein [Gammaproteobacteria bacterium]|nr:glycosyltransferase family 2 protein [Gammaproteobacteria bacterium]